MARDYTAEVRQHLADTRAGEGFLWHVRDSGGRDDPVQRPRSSQTPGSRAANDPIGVGCGVMVGGPRRSSRFWREWEAGANAGGYEPFDPLNRVNLGRSLETALLAKPIIPLGGVPPFWGSGIYAIYFRGSAAHALYGRLADSPAPIYVGRAVPRGARKGLVAEEEDRRSRALWSRLDEHRATIEQARDLSLEDFWCRWLVADMLFVPMAESLLIQTYRPLWNVLIDGFGNHDPGGGRYNQERSRWDTLHEGRYWAARLAEPPYTAAGLRASVENHLEEIPPEEAPALPPVTSAQVINAVPEDEPDIGDSETLFD